MQPWKENGSAISSEEVNFLVFRYLQESGEGNPAATSLVCATYVEIAAPPLPGYDSSVPASTLHYLSLASCKGFVIDIMPLSLSFEANRPGAPTLRTAADCCTHWRSPEYHSYHHTRYH